MAGKLSMVTTAVTLPVLEFSIAISFALIVSGASLVDLHSDGCQYILNDCQWAVLI